MSKQLKLKLGQMLADCLRNADIKQKELAKSLDISNSAVSQMMHGKLVPNQYYLKKIYELASIDRTTAHEFESILAKIRCGNNEERSLLNDLIFGLRCEQGLNVRQVANLSKVSTIRINNYENDPDAVVSKEDAERLAPVLGCSSKLLMFPGSDDTQEFNEITTNYSSEIEVPVLTITDMEQYEANTPIMKYAIPRALSAITTQSIPEQVDIVALNASARSLAIGIPGNITVFLADKQLSNNRDLRLCRNGDGKYWLIEYRNGKRKAFKIAGVRLGKQEWNIQWEIPVIELQIKMSK